MAIDAYTGLPRSGKSYSVVKNVILPSLREGRSVYTNIPLTPLAVEEFGQLVNQLPADWFSRPDLFASIPPGAVVVLDELWRRWPSGMKTSAVLFQDKEFLAEHGHNVDSAGNTTRVVLVTQDLSQIASFARDLVAMTYRAEKLDAVGADGRFRVDVYKGSVSGQKPPKSQMVRQLFDKYEETVWRYYKSSTKSQTGDVGNESRADKRGNIWRSPWLIASFVAPVLLIPPLLWYIVHLFGSGLGQADKASAKAPLVNPPPPVAAARVPSAAQSQAAPAVPAGPRPSTKWRIAGYMLKGSQPANRAWSSVEGYSSDGATPSGAGRIAMGDVVILQNPISGIRYVQASECMRYPDGIQWRCVVDGEVVETWTGRGDATSWANGNQLVSRTVSTVTENPPPPSPPDKRG